MERRLDGVRVLVTRPRERSETLCFLLEDEGAHVHALPLLELQPPADPRPLEAAAEHVGRYRWVVLASPSGAEAFLEACRTAGTLDRLAHVRLAAVGPRTARTVQGWGLKVAAEPAGNGPALYAALQHDLQPGDDVLLPAAEEGRRELEDALREHGVRVTRVVAYRSTPAALPPDALEALDAARPEAVLFASPRTAEAFLDLAGRERLAGVRVVAIGPTTAGALEAHGVPVAATAEAPTPEALVDATVRAVRGA